MRVKIGPYRDWIGPYQIADMVFFWVDRKGIRVGEEFGEQPWGERMSEKFGDWLADTWVNDFCNWADKFKKRKIKVHIDPYDTWSMDHTLAFIILPMLKQLRDTKHGSAFVDDEDVPENLRSTSAPPKKNEWDTDDFVHDRWDWVLNEMIWAFEQKVDDDSEYKYYNQETQTWDHDNLKIHQERMSNGFKLFGKYYQGLWD